MTKKNCPVTLTPKALEKIMHDVLCGVEKLVKKTATDNNHQQDFEILSIEPVDQTSPSTKNNHSSRNIRFQTEPENPIDASPDSRMKVTSKRRKMETH